MNSDQAKTAYIFTAESLRKKFRFSEFFAEKLITSVAFLSIAVIILIFFFVFRESLPAFKGKPKATTENKVSAGNKPESYGSSEPATAEQKPETYSGEEKVTTEKKPETYTGAEPTAANKPETNGADKDTSVSADEVNPDASLRPSAKAENEGSLGSLFGSEWFPVSENPRYGMIPLFVGTFKVTLIAILFAAPIAILAALFSSSFASPWLREWIKPAIELLAGFPSVVIGFFALMVMATFFQNLFGYETRLNSFVGGIAMALAAIPIIFTITEDALTAIPATYKEASLALGASKWQTAVFVTLPAATPGIFAAVLLGVGRVFGETMIALMATGNAALSGLNPFESVRTLAATIGAEMAEVVFGDMHYGILFLIGSLLFVFNFSINAIAEFYIKGKLIKKIQGR
ncbi:MAG: phosphate ABC transporter permease subunit PstC [Bacteroidetes bacterium]|nr:phosphate ABC transporter permease subunit PstC [Bacteroidota bacterium]